MKRAFPPVDVIVFSHLRWDFVFQRPQHLLTRCAGHRPVFFVEEPVFEQGITAHLEVSRRDQGVSVVLPRLPTNADAQQVDLSLQRLVEEFVREHVSSRYVAWYYTPMALKFTRALKPVGVVYDCMDELSHFKGAPVELCVLEGELLQMADVVFTGGVSLYEHKRRRHGNIFPFPSSVDVAHFARARSISTDPADQVALPCPRIGYAGVIDERFDIDLVAAVARTRPSWQFVLIGPVVKIAPETLPRLSNIHYLGPRPYAELPNYMAGWNVAMLPFARNEATRFISPTKTPEYLAAGKRVVSTSIRDVVRGYGEPGLVRIADDPAIFVQAVESSLAAEDDHEWLSLVDDALGRMSWQRTYDAMWRLVEQACRRRTRPKPPSAVGVTPSPVLEPRVSESAAVASPPG